MDKRKLRKITRKRLMKIKNKRERSEAIQLKIIHEKYFTNANSIICYINHKLEVGTRAILEEALQANKDVFVPCLSELSVKRLESLEDIVPLKNGFFDIITQPITNTSSFDLCITPGLAFTREGKRLGRGGGWYDRFFSKNKIEYKVGLCFEELIFHDFETEKHDIVMDSVVTD